MITDWQALSKAALKERDSVRIPEACEKARRAIFERLMEIERPSQAAVHAKEIQALDNASRQLCLYERNHKLPLKS